VHIVFGIRDLCSTQNLPAQLTGRLSDHQKDGILRAAPRGESRVEWERERNALRDIRSSPAGRSASLGRIAQTAEAVQHDCLLTSAALESQGYNRLAAEVERFRHSLSVPRTRQERAMPAFAHSRAERPPMQLKITR